MLRRSGPKTPKEKWKEKRRAERLKKRNLRQFGTKAFRKLVAEMNCCACGNPPPSQLHHVKTRGAGGTYRDIAPLCYRCHSDIHNVGSKTFQLKKNVDLRAVADAIFARLKPILEDTIDNP